MGEALGSLGVRGRYDGDARPLASADVRDEVGDFEERQRLHVVEDDDDGVVGSVILLQSSTESQLMHLYSPLTTEDDVADIAMRVAARLEESICLPKAASSPSLLWG